MIFPTRFLRVAASMGYLVPYPAAPLMAPAAAALPEAMAAGMRNTGRILPLCCRRCRRRLPRFMLFFSE